jgi:hypothetical protein
VIFDNDQISGSSSSVLLTSGWSSLLFVFAFAFAFDEDVDVVVLSETYKDYLRKCLIKKNSYLNQLPHDIPPNNMIKHLPKKVILQNCQSEFVPMPH